MVIVDSDCRIIRANQAARQMLGFAVDSPDGDRIEQYIPMLANIIGSGRIAQLKPTMIETRGRHLDGQEVCLNVWVSVHPTPTGPTLSAVLLDVTAQVRDHAEAGLRQLLLNSRVIAGAVSHELRNLCFGRLDPASEHEPDSRDPSRRRLYSVRNRDRERPKAFVY